jgi:1-pyrroline-5-carboxylate dehydrogenase
MNVLVKGHGLAAVAARYNLPAWHQQPHRNKSTSSSFRATNEPILDFAHDSKERAELSRALQAMLATNKVGDKREALHDVPIVIGDKEIRTNNVRYQLVPFDHGVKLARFYHADKELIGEAIESCMQARAAWEASSPDYRAGVLLKVADKISGAKRSDVLAATMLGQGKTVFQAGNDFLFLTPAV